MDEGAGYTYYLYLNPNQNISSFRPEFAAEFQAMQGAVQEIVKRAELFMPVDPFAGMAGKKLSFNTTDINGNPVSSEELFGQHEITMLNVWASWCGPCVGELSELEAINGRLAGKNCAVVGLLYDGADPDAVQTAKGILQEKGVTYTIILPPDNVDELFDMSAFPTTFFVDKTGTLVGKPVEGAAVDAYEGAVDGLLSAGSTAELKQIYKDIDKDIQRIDFDVFAKGPDQNHAGFQSAVEWCKNHGKEVVVVPRTEGISSTLLREYSKIK